MHVKRLRKQETRASDGLSTWTLNSPTSRNSLGVVAARERSEPNSSRKTKGFWE